MTRPPETERPCFLYFLYDGADRLLYVGMTDDVEVRMRAHEATKEWWREVDHRWVVTYPSRATCAAAEALTIHALRPAYNVQIPDGGRCAVLSARSTSEVPSPVHAVVEIDEQRQRADRAVRRVEQLEQQLERQRQRVEVLDRKQRELLSEMRRGHTELHHLIWAVMTDVTDGYAYARREVLDAGLRQIRGRSWEIANGQPLTQLRDLEVFPWRQWRRDARSRLATGDAAEARSGCGWE